MHRLIILLLVSTPFLLQAQKRVITSQSYHLRHGATREWTTFPVDAKSRLTISFNAKYIDVATLSLTQYDVSHSWIVKLNDKKLGTLVTDEQKMVSYYEIPAGMLKKSRNILVIEPEKSEIEFSDDIIISDISLFKTSPRHLFSETRISITVGNEKNELIPSRLTIVNRYGALQPLSAAPGDTMAIRAGVIYSGTGHFSFTLPEGSYTIYASRGFEYGVDSFTRKMGKGDRVQKSLNIEHEVLLKEWTSCDTHIHTREYSGHGDATMKERVLSIAGEGLDYAVITEHNKVVNIQDTVEKMGMQKWFTPVSGDELTTKVGHFNIFPANEAPSADVKSWNEVAEKTGSDKVVILNHGRDVHNGFRPLDSLYDKSKWILPVNAMEVMNSGSQQTDPAQLYMDWIKLMNKGIFLTPIGSSDSHYVSRFIVGQARTYVYRDSGLVANILKGRVGVSFGLFTEIIINGKYGAGESVSLKETVLKDSIPVTINVYAPSWIKAHNVVMYANGKKIYSANVFNNGIKGLAGKYQFSIAIPDHDVVLVAVAEGPDPGVAWWPIARPYQHNSAITNPMVLGITGAVKINADGSMR